MPAHIREYQRAPDAEHALALLERTTIKTVSLIPRPRVPDPGFPQAAAVVDLQGLAWDYISREPERLRIGAHATLQMLAENVAIRNVASGVLRQASQLAAPRTLRNLATLAGALDGAAEGPPELLLALLALDAQAVVQNKESATQIPLRQYHPTSTTLLVEVAIDLTRPGVASLARVARTPLDQAIVAAVAALSGDVARVAVAGANATPIVVQANVEGPTPALVDRLVDAVKTLTQPVGDYRGSTEYRRVMAGILARRALEECFNQGANA